MDKIKLFCLSVCYTTIIISSAGAQSINQSLSFGYQSNGNFTNFPDNDGLSFSSNMFRADFSNMLKAGPLDLRSELNVKRSYSKLRKNDSASLKLKTDRNEARSFNTVASYSLSDRQKIGVRFARDILHRTRTIETTTNKNAENEKVFSNTWRSHPWLASNIGVEYAGELGPVRVLGRADGVWAEVSNENYYGFNGGIRAIVTILPKLQAGVAISTGRRVDKDNIKRASRHTKLRFVSEFSVLDDLGIWAAFSQARTEYDISDPFYDVTFQETEVGASYDFENGLELIASVGQNSSTRKSDATDLNISSDVTYAFSLRVPLDGGRLGNKIEAHLPIETDSVYEHLDAAHHPSGYFFDLIPE